jgi:predicted AAA+ superfamily ATPase
MALQRKAEKVIRDYLSRASNKMMVIDGARQVGKSFIIPHLFPGTHLSPTLTFPRTHRVQLHF